MSQAPLVFTKEDNDIFVQVLLELLRKSESRCVLLVDQSGRCVARVGSSAQLDVDALAALIAGSFASTRAMASLVGETEFSVLFHQGQHDNIHNVLADNDRILSVIFDRRTTVGMVRLYTKQAAEKIAARFREIEAREVASESPLRDSMPEETGARIDQIFGA